MPFDPAQYEPVEDRIRAFWEDHPTGRITTDHEEAPEGEYVFVAYVYRDPEERPAATGWAHESVAQLPANMKASALEVCETSAIGRALANLGYAPKGKRPSREEMTKTSGAVGSGMGPAASGNTSEEGAASGKSAPSSDSSKYEGTRPAPSDPPAATCDHPLEQQYEATSGRIKCRICKAFVD